MKEYWGGLPFPSPGDLPDPGSNPGLLHCNQTLYRLSYNGNPVNTTNTYLSYLKSQWTKCSNQKTQSGRLDRKEENKTRDYNMLPTRDPLWGKGHT